VKVPLSALPQVGFELTLQLLSPALFSTLLLLLDESPLALL
jgi:hypothetical protein